MHRLDVQPYFIIHFLTIAVLVFIVPVNIAGHIGGLGWLYHGFSKKQIAQSSHYNDVMMTTIASQITSLTVVCSTVYSDADQRKHQSSASLALCGEFTGTGEFPAQRASYAENVSIWWRHHEACLSFFWLWFARRWMLNMEGLFFNESDAATTPTTS